MLVGDELKEVQFEGMITSDFPAANLMVRRAIWDITLGTLKVSDGTVWVPQGNVSGTAVLRSPDGTKTTTLGRINGGASYALNYPASLPASATLMLVDTSGNVTFPISNAQDGQVLKDVSVPFGKAAVRPATGSPGGLVTSSKLTTQTVNTGGGSLVDLTNMTVTITTVGGIIDVWLSGASPGHPFPVNESSIAPSGGLAAIYLVETTVFGVVETYDFSSSQVPGAFRWRICGFPAGTYTFKLQGGTASGASLALATLVLNAIEMG